MIDLNALIASIVPTVGLIILGWMQHIYRADQKKDRFSVKEMTEKRLEMEEYDLRMTRASRALSFATATAVRDGESNGELTKALEDFKRAGEGLDEEKDKIIRDMMSINSKR